MPPPPDDKQRRSPGDEPAHVAQQFVTTQLRAAECFVAFVTTLLEQGEGGCQHCTTVAGLAMIIASRCDLTGHAQADLLAEVTAMIEQFAQRRRGEVPQ